MGYLTNVGVVSVYEDHNVPQITGEKKNYTDVAVLSFDEDYNILQKINNNVCTMMWSVLVLFSHSPSWCRLFTQIFLLFWGCCFFISYFNLTFQQISLEFIQIFLYELRRVRSCDSYDNNQKLCSLNPQN